MSQKVNILLTFDLTAILAGRSRDWTLFDQIGPCLITQVVMEEIEFLGKRSPNPEEEKTAREFSRFMDDSNWQISQIVADYPGFNAAGGQDLSKNARLKQAITQSVYGLARENQARLVVLISNQQNLRNDIDGLEINNLCSLPLAQFVQWLRTKQLPLNVSKKMQKMIGEGISTSETKSKKTTSTPQTKIKNSSSSKLSNGQNNYQKIKAKVVKKSNFLSNLISSILAIIGFSFVGLLLWYLIQPNTFHEFWQKTGLPALPNNSSEK
jgi:hypothetical protein